MDSENKMQQNDGAQQGNVHTESDAGENKMGKQGSTLSEDTAEPTNESGAETEKQTRDNDTLGNP